MKTCFLPFMTLRRGAQPAAAPPLRLVAMDAVRTRDLFLRTFFEALSPICLLSEPAYAAFWLPETGDMP